jgi:uncharacterized cupredoxin-like copper-binding protein
MARSSSGCRRSPRAAVFAVLVVVLGATTGCSSGSSPAKAAKTVVHVTEGDFEIAATPNRVPAGDVVVSVQNTGPDNHELIVVRAGNGRLPVRADGITIDEDALESAKVGALEAGQPGSTRELHLRLSPGRYELFCNMSGHFFGGMYTDLVVT